MNNEAVNIIDKIEAEEKISKEDAFTLLSSFEYDNNINKKELNEKEEENIKELKEYLRVKARNKADKIFGKYVFMRGLIEFTNYCKNDCIYCGIRKSNKNADRYRLSKEEILSCCQYGYKIGFRTFVLQGGEDPYYDLKTMSDIVKCLLQTHCSPSCPCASSSARITYSIYPSSRKDRLSASLSLCSISSVKEQ